MTRMSPIGEGDIVHVLDLDGTTIHEAIADGHSAPRWPSPRPPRATMPDPTGYVDLDHHAPQPDRDGYLTDWHGSPDSYGTEDAPQEDQ